MYAVFEGKISSSSYSSLNDKKGLVWKDVVHSAEARHPNPRPVQRYSYLTTQFVLYRRLPLTATSDVYPLSLDSPDTTLSRVPAVSVDPIDARRVSDPNDARRTPISG